MTEHTRIEIQKTRVRTKINVEVDLVLHDGTRLNGLVFIGLDERVQDLLNDAKPFFPLKQNDGEVILINKSAVAVCKPLDTPG
ncbi:MAG: hypothetical protein ACOY99_00660 [Pseudomonadota bacterium]